MSDETMVILAGAGTVVTVALIMGVVAVALRALNRCPSEQVPAVLAGLTRFAGVLLRSRRVAGGAAPASLEQEEAR
ncbi:hypothetical protein HS048_36475 [Planomonospora sp. ID91781]|uniref:Uncharacterized protein n=2 Tax=Planomonospora parontospora TaxID=58119 RepID=A0AA37BNU5_9ACTN|nr:MULTISPECIES: hypothetical protein [Planomonospora]MBG0826165.1 hypothetical protein [Planomonospora sp. ID91781]GGK99370.1 hypothetical protein GCM10010126_68640 [Planomonospora parontospora]GII12946.1 hypothetical protein Ppa06_67440 [Planomonospora parontospora subsp. parontospora]